MNKTKFPYDAILVLGSGLDKRLFKNRVEKAVALYNQEQAPLVIFSGRCWGGFKPRPKVAEATLMARYARSLGLPRKASLKETKSLNTLGNFYFTYRLFLKPLNIRSLLIITHPHHFAKSKYFAKKVLGPKYKFKFMADGKQLSEISNKKSEQVGHMSVREVNKFFGHIKDGNLKKIQKVMFAYHHYRGYKVI